MAASGFLNSGLRELLPPNHKRDLLGHLWELDKLPTYLTEISDYGDSYFLYYTRLCAATTPNVQESLGILTHQNIVDVIRLLQNPEATRQDVKDGLGRILPDQTSPDCDRLMLNLMNFLVRLWLMLDVGNYLTGVSPGQTQLHWTDESLRTLIDSRFNTTHALEPAIKLERRFNAHNLEKIAGIKISWTNNLADHLRMIDDNTRVAVFHHAFFLHCHKTYQVFSLGFIEETLRTLALLFPEHDAETAKWFKKYQADLKLDSLAIKCGQLNPEDRNIEEFTYWRDRLVILKEAFDETEPRAIKQWWFDRRNRVQWYTFWIAVLVLVLTICFGFIQSIEGGIQAYAALHP